MNAIGIDVSKGKSMVAALQPGGKLLARPFEVLHTKSGIQELVSFIRSLKGDTRIVMEHTGRYYEPMLQRLAVSDLFICAVNPKLIKDFGGNSLRKVKTDKADAKKIARYALDNWCDLRQHTGMDTTRTQLKTMNRQFGLLHEAENCLQEQSHRPHRSGLSRCQYLFRKPRKSGRLAEMGGLCQHILARRLCLRYEPFCLYRALPQVVSSARLQLSAGQTEAAHGKGEGSHCDAPDGQDDEEPGTDRRRSAQRAVQNSRDAAHADDCACREAAGISRCD